MFELLDMVIVRPIVNLLFIIYNFVGDFGLAIIIFTIIVKFLMWPLVKKQMHQTRAMRTLQPELAEIKKNAKGNRQLESIQMMDLYKRKNIKPFRSMLSLLIQLPIFIALYTAIRVVVTPPTVEMSVEKSAYSFIQDLPRVQNLITDHESFSPQLFNLVDLSATAGLASIDAVVILIFALIAAATQYVMARQQNPSSKTQKRSFKQIMREASSGKEPDQSELNSVVSGQMTKFMPLMMLLIMINLPGALVFYYMLTNIVTVVQQKVILSKNFMELDNIADKKILKELKEAQEAQIIKDDTNTQKKNNKQKITRISASNKKKRR